MHVVGGLYPHQQEAIRELVRHHAAQQRILLVLPTGGGKTRTAATYVTTEFLRHRKRVIWIAHTQELLDQAYETFEGLSVSERWICRRYGPHDDTQLRPEAPLWLVNNLVESARPAQCDLLVIDEAHHAAAPTYKRWMSTYHAQAPGGAKVLGLTATPYRMVKRKSGPLTALTFGRPSVPLFESIAYERSFNDLVAEDRLVPFRHHRVETNMPVDLAIRDGEVTPESLALLDTPARNERIASYWRSGRETFGRTLVFAANADHARNLARAFGSEAEWLLGGHARAERRDAIARFRSGETRVLVNVGIFREGVDVPQIQTVLLARPTASAGLFTQMVGRGARKHPGKSFFHLIDVHDQLGAFEDYLCGVDVLRSGDMAVEDTVAERTVIAMNVASTALADVAEDGRLLLDVRLAVEAGKLSEYAGWISFAAAGEPTGMGILLRKANYDTLATLADSQGIVFSSMADRAFELERAAPSRSLWRSANVLSQGFGGRLRPFSPTRDDGLVSLVRLAQQVVPLGGAALGACARGVERIEDHGWRWRVSERDIAAATRRYVVDPDRYAAVMVYQDPRGTPSIRLLTRSSAAVLLSIATDAGYGIDHLRSRLSADLLPLEPDLAAQAPWLADHIVGESPTWSELVVDL